MVDYIITREGVYIVKGLNPDISLVLKSKEVERLASNKPNRDKFLDEFGVDKLVVGGSSDINVDITEYPEEEFQWINK